MDTIDSKLRSEVITKIELNLQNYKKRINLKEIEENCDQIPVSWKTNQDFTKIQSNSDNNSIDNSDIILNVRKSERISKQKSQSFGPKGTEKVGHQMESRVEIRSDLKIGQTIGRLLDHLSTEEGSTPVLDKGKDQIEAQIRTNISSEEGLMRRKWRRTKDINDLKCKYCGKLWRSMSHLEIHLRTHTGEKTYECQHCGQRFAQSAGLQVHLRRHNNDRRFGCDLCHKAFYTKIDLNRHKSSHKLNQNITHCCEKCGKGFSESRKLKNHIRFDIKLITFCS